MSKIVENVRVGYLGLLNLMLIAYFRFRNLVRVNLGLMMHRLHLLDLRLFVGVLISFRDERQLRHLEGVWTRVVACSESCLVGFEGSRLLCMTFTEPVVILRQKY